MASTYFQPVWLGNITQGSTTETGDGAYSGPPDETNSLGNGYVVCRRAARPPPGRITPMPNRRPWQTGHFKLAHYPRLYPAISAAVQRPMNGLRMFSRRMEVRKALPGAAILMMLAVAQQPQHTLDAPSATLTSLEGRVTERSGRPIQKAGLTLTGPPGSQPYRIYQTSSGPDGSFSFTAISPGTYTLRAERAGYLRGDFRVNPHETFSAITLSAGQRLNPINITMARSVTISGRVLDADGDPVASRNCSCCGAPSRQDSS